MIIKNICKLAVIGLALLSLSACSDSSNKSKLPDSKTSVDKILDEQVKNADNDLDKDEADASNKDTKNEDSNSDKKNQSNENNNTGSNEENIDFDLTSMSSEMVYATVFQLVSRPDDYIGKKVKMAGAYYVSSIEEYQKDYHYVIIADATACCTQGIEFVWEDGSHVYPDEYPPEGTEVEVVGIFESYIDEDDGYNYCRLKNASMKIVE